MRGPRKAPAPLPPATYRELVRRDLELDLGRAGDLTSAALATPGRIASAVLVARRSGRICGLEPALEAFRILDPEVGIERALADGADVDVPPAGDSALVARLRGEAAALLAAERTALNLLAHLSGIATATRDLAARLEGSRAHLVDTRKTTPGLRALEKYAVRVGGGRNHRFGLDDGVLVKDNHLRLVKGGLREAVRRVRDAVGHMVVVEVEVDTLEQLAEAVEAGVDAVLLDNMAPDELRRAVETAGGRVLLEASGGITPETVAEVAATGVDLISVGWITHSAPALDVALDFE